MRPNLNFDNEKKTHIPYSEIMRGKLKSSYETMKQPTNTKQPDSRISTINNSSKSFKRWFTK